LHGTYAVFDVPKPTVASVVLLNKYRPVYIVAPPAPENVLNAAEKRQSLSSIDREIGVIQSQSSESNVSNLR